MTGLVVRFSSACTLHRWRQADAPRGSLSTCYSKQKPYRDTPFARGKIRWLTLEYESASHR